MCGLASATAPNTQFLTFDWNGNVVALLCFYWLNYCADSLWLMTDQYLHISRDYGKLCQKPVSQLCIL